MEIKKFENKLIAFDFESDYLNATDLLKAFNEVAIKSETIHTVSEKRMDNFLRAKGVQEFIDVLESDARKSAPDFQALIQKRNRYDKSVGTWMHKLLAYRFASWLCPEFELFVYKTFDEAIRDKLKYQQMQLDYFWDKSDRNDIYKRTE